MEPHRNGTLKLVKILCFRLWSGLCLVLASTAMAGSPRTVPVDYSRSAIHNGPAAGKIFNNPFRVVSARLLILGYDTVTNGNKVADRAQKYHLELKGDNEFISDTSLLFIFSTNVGKPLQNLILPWKPAKFGSSEHSAQSFGNGKYSVGRGWFGVHAQHKEAGTRLEMYGTNISGRLEFGKPSGGKISGRVVFVAPDGTTYVTGNFLAKIEKL